jgi:hypothetical protein
MPSPFTRRQAATSKTDVDRPVAVTPVPESVKGHVFAYRGMETHGVDPNNTNVDPEEYGWMEEERGVIVDYEPAEEAIDPIPVFIVQKGGKELRRWRSMTATAVTDRVSCVLSADPFRRKVVIKNTSTDVVYVGHEQTTASAMHGYPLAQNETLTLESQDSVYAFPSASNPCVLAFAIEFVTEHGASRRD